MRLIDAEALADKFREEYIKTDCTYTQPFICASLILLEKFIKAAPTVEAKPVVYCKDCEYFNPHCQSCFLHWQEDDDPNVFCFQTNPDDYCSFAEKRDKK